MNLLREQPRLRDRAVLLLALTGIYWLGTLYALEHYPAVWVDEGWIAEPAWVLAHGGELGNPSHGTGSRFNDRVYWNPPLEFLALAALDRTGLDPLLGGRLLSALAGYLTLLLLAHWALMESIGAFAPRPAGPRGGSPPRSSVRRDPLGGNFSQDTVLPGSLFPLLAVLAVGVAFTADPVLWKTHRTIRFEALTGLWSLAAVAAPVFLPKFWRGAAVGLFSGLALCTHPNGALAAAAGGGILLLAETSRRDRLVSLTLAAATGILVLLPWLVYLNGDRGADFANLLGQNAPHLHGRTHSLFRQWWEERHRYADYFHLPYLLLPLVLWVFTGLIGLRRRAPSRLLWPLAVYAAGLACLPNKSGLYLTLAAPILYLLAVWVALRWRPRRLVFLVAALWIANLVLVDTGLLRRNRACDRKAWAAPLVEAAAPGASVAGTFLTWFDFKDRTYLEFMRRRAGDVYDARPDYIVWGEALQQTPNLARLRRELGPVLAAHADTVAHTGSSPCYGTAVLYRPRWEEVPPALAQSWRRYGEPE